MYARTYLHIFFFLTILCLIPPRAHAEDQDETLRLLGQPLVADPVAGRLPRQLSRTPENTTVITAKEIEALNAHTLIDILTTIPGIQMENQVGSVNLTYTKIQGSNYSHVQVLLDGIPFNNLGDNYSDIGRIPAQIIERVEIVKGAASSAWGQALGGVINVITKSPEPERSAGGMLAIASGERRSIDAGGELSGTVDRLGYYLSGGHLESAGFRPNTGFDSASGHVRLTWELPQSGQAGLLLNYAQHGRGQLAFAPFDVKSNDDARRLILGLSLIQPLGNRLEIKFDSFHSDNRTGIDVASLSNGQPQQALKYSEQLSGGSAKLLWRLPANMLVAGVDLQHAIMRSNDALVSVDQLNKRVNRWGFYLNDTYSVGDLALSTGARYDLTGSSSNQFSPSLGLTWQLTDNTLLRGYTAKGFSLPGLLLDRESEKVWTSQIGAESSAVPYLWLKGTLFRNDTRDVTTYNSINSTIGSERQIKQGAEIEARTAQLLNTSLHSGYSYVDARRSPDHSVVRDVPSQTLHLGLQFDDHKYFKGLLTGRHIFWNAESYHNGSYHGMLWDMHLNSTPFSGDFKQIELFFSLRNIFNGKQYLDEIYRNNRRWVEGGVRFRF
jgi:vitamin B12 transporter